MLSRRSLLALAAATTVGVPRLVSGTTPPPALFIAAHPDDETLAMGVAIAEHAALGQDVHVLWLTRGQASGAISKINGTVTSSWWGVPHDPAVEGYAPLSAAEFGAARIAEATNAVNCLGDITVHEGGLADGQLTQADAEAAIVAVADQIAPGGAVRLKTHSHTVDDHSDHLATGNAVLALGDAEPARFDDRRYYVLSWYWDDPRLSQVSQTWDYPGSPEVAARAVNACRCYGAWSPPHTYAIGHHSVPGLWPPLMAQPKCMVHA